MSARKQIGIISLGIMGMRMLVRLTEHPRAGARTRCLVSPRP